MEGEQIGVVTLEVAMSLADEAEIDLVEIAPTAQPPVCRLMDYGKFRYQESKKKISILKEIISFFQDEKGQAITFGGLNHPKHQKSQEHKDLQNISIEPFYQPHMK